MHVELHSRFADRPAAIEAAGLTSACVHCGFCLATCPTYLDTRDERDSPRGRIYLIKQLLETGEASAQTHTHLDRCLTCRSCETTCPSGMRYGELLDIGRGLMEQQVPRPVTQRGVRWLLRGLLSRPPWFAAALRLGQAVRPLLPPGLRQQVPPRRAATRDPLRHHGRTLLLLDGCVQAAATPDTNRSARRVCDRLGIALRSARRAGCCGAVNYHLAAHEDGLNDMRRNIDAWWPHIESGAEAVVTSATGCGSMLADYGRLLANDPAYAAKARRVSELARDLAEVLLQEDLGTLALKPDAARVAVQTPCSLQHGRKLPALITTLLDRAGFNLVAVRDGHLCCGSAGTYSVLHPEMAQRLRDRKLDALTGEAPDLIATGNVGCQLHLQAGTAIPIVHWIELLDRVIPGKSPRS